MTSLDGESTAGRLVAPPEDNVCHKYTGLRGCREVSVTPNPSGSLPMLWWMEIVRATRCFGKGWLDFTSRDWLAVPPTVWRRRVPKRGLQFQMRATFCASIFSPLHANFGVHPHRRIRRSHRRSHQDHYFHCVVGVLLGNFFNWHLLPFPTKILMLWHNFSIRNSVACTK